MPEIRNGNVWVVVGNVSRLPVLKLISGARHIARSERLYGGRYGETKSNRNTNRSKTGLGAKGAHGIRTAIIRGIVGKRILEVVRSRRRRQWYEAGTDERESNESKFL